MSEGYLREWLLYTEKRSLKTEMRGERNRSIYISSIKVCAWRQNVQALWLIN